MDADTKHDLYKAHRALLLEHLRHVRLHAACLLDLSRGEPGPYFLNTLKGCKAVLSLCEMEECIAITEACTLSDLGEEH